MLIKSTVALVALTVAVPVWAQDLSCGDLTAKLNPERPLSSQSVVITVDQAIASALKNDLRHEAAQASVSAARSEKQIASLRPPDQFNFQTEDFPGTGPLDNTNSLEVTASYARVWERGGKRDARKRLAASGVDIAEAAVTISDNQIAHDVRRLYNAALIATARQTVACMEIKHVSEIKSAIETRVQRSSEPVLAATRASTELLTAQSDFRLYGDQEASYLEQLSRLIGQNQAIKLDQTVLQRTPDVRSIDPTFSSLPELQMLDAQQREAQAKVKLEQAGRKADITWNVGVRSFGVTDDIGLVTGFSIPLGAGSRSNAKTAKARAEALAIEAEKRALIQQTERQATILRQSSLRSIDMLKTLNEQLIPQGDEALQLAEEGYRRGALPFRDVLDAHESLIALHKLRIDHFEIFLNNDADLQRLRGHVNKTETQP